MSWFSLLLDGASAYIDARGREERAEQSQRDREAVRLSNEAQAAVAEGNAQIADWQAADALYRGRVAVGAVGAQGRALKAQQTVAYTASGVALDSGSVVGVLTDTDILTATEAGNAKDTAAREAWAYRLQAMDSRNRAHILRSSALPAADNPDRAFYSSLISGAARAYGNEERRR